MIGRSARRIGLTVAAGLLASSASFGYYHFVHYLTRTAPFTPVYEKFDLNALSGKTVQFRISDQGPAALAPNDSLPSLYSHIRAAAKVWNGVDTSDLRLAFGGIGNENGPESTPGIDVVFGEVPPGIVAMGAPTVRTDVTLGPNGPFIPITRSVRVLREERLTQRRRVSRPEVLFKRRRPSRGRVGRGPIKRSRKS